MNLKRSVASFLILGALAMGPAIDAQAAAISTLNLSGDAEVTGFADGTPGTFTADLDNLSGSVNLVALPDGNYNVSVEGSLSLPGFPLVNIPLTPIFSGALSSTGLTPGNYNFIFGTSLGVDIPFAFDISYDGNTSAAVLAALNSLTGASFVDPAGAGTLGVTGTFFANGTSAQINFTESNLSWAGFGALLAGVDGLLGSPDGQLAGTFGVDMTVTAAPEPGTLLLLSAGLLGLVSRRQRAKALA
ncbi:MAG: PEP-CTERM sorting domain-containing protein [Candidatus Competibacteraceae bacterium]|nr:PEP-CTERM sorting domain-containing protein [Candidatus Competibacteraceae bacterium]